ncbi:pentatricopeptide repeat-containing protein At4g08210 [Ziziphus jujuba]|uniref:Pentatricopeptide repeat-containing protein At4g08210 n=1 Tax=Ziziphus jujuba TaxID=326968 RepID=A0A6P6G7W7_ZIZJJ|nr:pentatricopeptide repeat-containing protein At4g08210 [Ziziphus jujuba]XP_024930219.3 pentatricopeptide repeat-containing protein At4g08210 [Ziziphus jujuba]
MDLSRIATALRHCGRVQAFNHGKAFHSHLVKTGCLNDIFLANNLISMYVAFHDSKDARKVFDEMPDKNVVTWTTMVSAYNDVGRHGEALGLFNHMLESESGTPNGFMYSAVLRACGLVRDLKFGKLIHKRISDDRLESDIVLMNSLLDMYVKCGSLGDAKNVFDGILFPNSTTWNTIISGYSKAGMMEDAVDLFNRMPKPNVVSWNSIIAGFTDKESPDGSEFVCRMHQEGLKLDGFTFPCVLKTCGRHGLLAFGKQIHCYVIKSGFEYGCFTVSALIDMYSDCNKLVAAENLFAQYSSSISDSLAIWNSMLSGYVINEHNSAALNIVSQVHRSGAYLDSYTFSGALKACINLQSLRLGLQVHGLAVTTGYELDDVIGSILIDFYARMGSIKDAMRLFHRLPKKDTVAWSGLIAGCAKMGLHWFAFSLFRDMVNLDIRVDQFVISSILKACSSLTSLRSGKQIHAFCIKSGYEYEGVMLTSLIDMYSKCGEIDDGLALFECTPERDTICWTGIIVGCGQNGRAEAAINYFHEMVKSGLKPNEITYLGVLSACRHAGLVDEALAIFNSMKTEKGLETYVEHYNCMVDLLGQAGRFEEAEKLITAMPCEPNQTIWRSLLGACQTHNNIELVNIIDKNLLATLPENPSTYVTLSNVYAALGKWDDLSKMRKSVKKVGAKEAGKSWIEISS